MNNAADTTANDYS
jgi:hypothetical protein